MRGLWLLFAVLCTSCASIGPAETQKPDSPTIAHELLSLDHKYKMVEDDPYRDMYRVVDVFVDDAGDRFELLGLDISRSRGDRDEALRVLQAIEATLVERNFLLYIRTETMADMLLPAAPKKQSLLTDERREHFFVHQTEDFFHFDCDLGSFMYMAVAETYSLPVSLVEVPNHNFVRWEFADGTHLNWDTNAAREYSDDDYRHGRSLTASKSFDSDVEARRGYLRSMTNDEVRGYYMRVLANRVSERGDTNGSEELLKESMRLRPNAPSARNSLSWRYVTRAELNTPDNVRLALEYSLAADAIAPESKTYKDTLACAYAANGRFDEAITAETLAHNIPVKLEGFSRGQTCLDLISSGQWEID